MVILQILFLFIFFLLLQGNCQAAKYDSLNEEIRSKIAPHLTQKTAEERYKIGVSIRKGKTIFKDSQEEFPPDSLSCFLAQKICFESIQGEFSSNSDLCNRTFHNMGMILLRLFEVEEAIEFFEKSNLEASKKNLVKIRKIEKKYKLCETINTYRQEFIYISLIFNNKIDTVNITRKEAEFFKFSETELKDIFDVADQVLRSIKKDQRAVLLPIGRSPFWITAATKLFPLPDSLKVIPLSFSQSKNNHIQENEYSLDQLRGYLKYLRENLTGVNSTDNIYF